MSNGKHRLESANLRKDNTLSFIILQKREISHEDFRYLIVPLEVDRL